MVDPINAFPPELVTYVFIFLSSRSHALMKGVNKEWRSRIQSDLILNGTIDLSDLIRKDIDALQLIKIVQQITSESTQDLHLDLRSFCQRPSFLTTEYLNLLETIFKATGRNLKNLFLIAPSSRYSSRSEALRASETILKSALDLSRRMNSIRKLQSSINLPIGVRITSSGSNPRSFQILPNNEVFSLSSDRRWDVHAVNRLFGRAERFTRGKLRNLQLSTSTFTALPEKAPTNEDTVSRAKELFTVLQEHQDSLEVLQLEAVSKSLYTLAWEFALLCPQVSSLQLSLQARFEDKNDQRIVLKVPTQAPDRHLKDLDLKIIDADLDWEKDSNSISKIVGTNLESLTFSCRQIFDDSVTSCRIPSQPLVSIINSNASLKSLDLELRTIRDSTASATQINLPHLIKLRLRLEDYSSQSLFSDVFLPQLQTLKIERFFPVVDSDWDDFMNLPLASYYSILKGCHLTLRELETVNGKLSVFAAEEEEDELQVYWLNFPLLENLKLDLWELPSPLLFQFPILKHLTLEVRDRFLEQTVHFLTWFGPSLETLAIRTSRGKRAGEEDYDLNFEHPDPISFNRLKTLDLSNTAFYLLDFLLECNFKLEEFSAFSFDASFEEEGQDRLFRFLRNHSASLKKLDFSYISFQAQVKPFPHPEGIHFASLTSMEFRSVDPFILKILLSRSMAPNLEELRCYISDVSTSRRSSDLCKVSHFLGFLQSSKILETLNLFRLDLGDDDSDGDETSQLPFSFSELKTLEVDSCSVNLYERLASLEYPKIKQLRFSSHRAEHFKEEKDFEETIANVQRLLKQHNPKLPDEDCKISKRF